MYVKVNRKPKGIPNCEVQCVPGVTDMGASQVQVYIRDVDSFGISMISASVRMSTKESRAIAAAMIAAADEADAMRRKV
jgi:hypothetical protein